MWAHEEVLADCATKQRLVAHMQSIDWNYEPAGEQDYTSAILELLALPGATMSATRCTGLLKQRRDRPNQPYALRA